MKLSLMFCIQLLSLFIYAQDKMVEKSGKIIFEASVPSFEEITALNDSVSCSLGTKTGEIDCIAVVKKFQFKLSLMEEHFNKNYLESNIYPTARFKGIINGFNSHIIGNTPKKFMLIGKLKIHGKSKKINTIVTLIKRNNQLLLFSDFDINLDDYGISIPSIVSYKVAKTIRLKSEFSLK